MTIAPESNLHNVFPLIELVIPMRCPTGQSQCGTRRRGEAGRGSIRGLTSSKDRGRPGVAFEFAASCDQADGAKAAHVDFRGAS